MNESKKVLRWVNIYSDTDGRYISRNDFSSYQEAYDNRDHLTTYIETVQIAEVPEVLAQSFEEILEGYHVTLEKDRMGESIKLAAEKYASQFKGHEVPCRDGEAQEVLMWLRDNYALILNNEKYMNLGIEKINQALTTTDGQKD